MLKVILIALLMHMAAHPHYICSPSGAGTVTHCEPAR